MNVPYEKTHDKECKPTSNAMQTVNAFWPDEPQNKLCGAFASCAAPSMEIPLPGLSCILYLNKGKDMPHEMLNMIKKKRGLNPC